MNRINTLYQDYGTYNIFYNQLNLPSPSVEYAWRRTKLILHEETKALISQLLHTKQEVSVCDIGCGNGGFLIRLATELNDKRIQYLGLDISKPFIDFANGAVKAKGLHNIDFKLYDVEKQQLPDPMDIFISSEVLEHLLDPVQFITKIHTSLNNPGYLLLSTPNAKNAVKYPLFFLKNLVTRKNEKELRKTLLKNEETFKLAEEEQHVRTFSVSELKNILTDSGFSVYRTPRSTTFFGGPFLDNHPLLLGSVLCFDSLVDILPLPQLGWDCIIFARKL